MVLCRAELKTACFNPQSSENLMKNLLARTLALLILATFTSKALRAQVPSLINYQGRVSVGTVNFDGPGSFKFALVNTDGTMTYWSNDGTSVAGSQPTAAVSLTVSKGLYSVLLGDTTLPNMTIVPASVFTNPDVRLRLWFNDGTNGFQLMTPDQRIAAVGYAMIAAAAQMAQTVPDSAITSAKIAAGAVGSTQIAAGAVQGTNIAAGAIGSTQLAAGVVGSAQLAAGSVGFAQLAKPPQAGVYTVDPFATPLVTVTFPTAYTVPPVITLTPGSSSTITNAAVTLVSTTAIGFSAAVSGLYASKTVDSSIASGYLSLQIVNGIPSISYSNINWQLVYVQANDINGTTWGTPVIVDNATGTPIFHSLQVVDGNPAISYEDYANGQLKYVRANDINGTTWGTPVIVDSGSAYTNLGPLSLQVINGNPAISYPSGNGKLKYVRANDINGTTWAAPIIADNVTGYMASSRVINGNPAISYTGSAPGNATALKYVRANDINGTSWGTPVIVNNPIGSDVVSLQIVNGIPSISYSNINGQLMYVRANDINGTTWGTPVIVDSSPLSNTAACLQVVNGIPSISYSNTNGQLKYVRANDINGATWGTAAILDTPIGFIVSGENQTSLQVVNENPAIAYYDANNQVLKIIIISGGTFH